MVIKPIGQGFNYIYIGLFAIYVIDLAWEGTRLNVAKMIGDTYIHALVPACCQIPEEFQRGDCRRAA